MPDSLKRSLVLLTSLFLIGGATVAVSSSPAQAATSCSAQDQRYGKTQTQAAQAAAKKKKTAKKVKRAKKAYKRNDSAVNKQRLKKARKADRKATKQLRARKARNTAAQQAAERCYVDNPSATPAYQQLLDQLAAYGVDPTDVQQLADLIDGAVPDGRLPSGTVLGVLQPVVGALTSVGVPTRPLVDALEGVIYSITGSDAPTAPEGLINVVLDAVQEALADTPAAPLGSALELIQTALAQLLGYVVG